MGLRSKEVQSQDSKPESLRGVWTRIKPVCDSEGCPEEMSKKITCILICVKGRRISYTKDKRETSCTKKLVQEVYFVLTQRAHSFIIQQTFMHTYHGARRLQRVQKCTEKRPVLYGSWCWEWGIFTESLIKVSTIIVFEKYSTSPDLASFLCCFFLGFTVFNLGDWGRQHSENRSSKEEKENGT